MKKSASSLRTGLAAVKGFGAAKHGVAHWWWQRVTALVLVPLLIWFIISLFTALNSPDVLKPAMWLSSPFNALFMVVMLVAMFFHAALGMQVVIEDYVHSPFAKYSLLLIIKIGCFLLATLALMAVLKLHFLDLAAGSV